MRLFLDRDLTPGEMAGHSRFVIRIPYDIAHSRRAKAAAHSHIEYTDIPARLRPLPRHHIAHHGEATRKGCFAHRAGTVKRACIRPSRLRQPLIPLGLLPARSPVGETARYLHSDTCVNPQPRSGSRSLLRRRRHAPDRAHVWRNKLLRTTSIAGHRQPCHCQQHPTSSAFHKSWPRFSQTYRRATGILEKA